MKSIPGITVHVYHKGQTSGDTSAYSANHISVQREDGTDKEFEICFVCSGAMLHFPSRQVARIEYHPDGINWCTECDAPLSASPLYGGDTAEETLQGGHTHERSDNAATE